MDRIAINANLTLEDWRALQAAAAGRIRGETVHGRWLRVLGSAAVSAVIVVLAFALFRGYGRQLAARAAAHPAGRER